MATAKQFVGLALSQDGDKYIFGVEASASDSNPKAFDCSELIQWISFRLGLSPQIPDGSWYQLQHCKKHGTLTSVTKAIETPAALLFSFSGDPWGRTRPRAAHVAISQGNGKTIEARSTRHGVGQFPANGRGWTHAGLVPGVNYEEADVTKEYADQIKIPLMPWARNTFQWMIDNGYYTEEKNIDNVRESYEFQQITVNLRRAIDNEIRNAVSGLSSGDSATDIAAREIAERAHDRLDKLRKI